jgi:ABC-type phosphate/phosphonate transport system permease subunit
MFESINNLIKSNHFTYIPTAIFGTFAAAFFGTFAAAFFGTFVAAEQVNRAFFNSFCDVDVGKHYIF